MTILLPLLALLPTALFACYYYKTKLNINLITSILWGLYIVYEYTMTCGHVCIRVDLIILYPMLFTISIFAIIKTLKKYKN